MRAPAWRSPPCQDVTPDLRIEASTMFAPGNARHRRTACGFALLLLLALAGAAPEPAASQAPADRAYLLAGTWTCRTIGGAQSHVTGTRDADTITVVNDVQPVGGRRFQLEDRFVFDAAKQLWSVSAGVGSPVALEAYAPPWTGRTWEIRGRDERGGVQRMRFELLDDGDLRRSYEMPSNDDPGTFRTYSAERCRPGDTPPPSGACIVENSTAQPVDIALPRARDLPMGTPYGTVRVEVGLDATSRIVSATIVQSTSPNLVAPALQAARASRFQTAVRDCRPVPAQYMVTFTFGR